MPYGSKLPTLNIFKLDDLEQNGWRENLRIHSVVESSERKDDRENIVLAVAEELNVEIRNYDVQRAHRLGMRKSSPNAEHRPIIVRFESYKKRNEILFAKAKSRDSTAFQSAFITEDIALFARNCLGMSTKNVKEHLPLLHLQRSHTNEEVCQESQTMAKK